MDLIKELEQLKDLEPMEVLNLERLTDKNSLSDARRKLVIKFHPDRHGEENEELAGEITAIINGAYQSIINDWDRLIEASEPEEEELIQKGKNYMGATGLKANQLKDGCEVSVTPFGIEGAEPVSVTIPPNTKSQSILVFEGLGEKSEIRNGDLILLCVAMSKKYDKEEIEVTGISNIVHLDVSDKVKIGMNTISLFDKSKIEMEKALDSEHILFIRNSVKEGTSERSVLLSY